MTPTAVLVLDSSTVLVPAKSDGYKFISLQNDGTVDVRLSISGGTPTSSLGRTLEANGGQLILTDSANPGSLQLGKNGINAINAISGTTGQSVVVEYW
jgi:hypothetical protein